MGKITEPDNQLAPIDNTANELFAEYEEMGLSESNEKKSLGFIPSFFTTASLPFKNLNKPEFVRKASNGISLILNSPTNVPYGKYGRLLLSVFTTHAVLSKKTGNRVIEFDSMAQLLKEMQLPRQRGKDIQEQLECFKRATFTFEQRKEEKMQGDLFKDSYEPGEKVPKGEVTVKTTTTGTILFTEGIYFQEIIDDSPSNPRIGKFKIVLSEKFAVFCQKHAVPIDYTVYKNISSPVGKDIYAWLVYKNNNPNFSEKGVFVPRDKLVEQFMPVSEGSDPKIANVNYSRIIDQIKEIKEKYYPELNFEIDKGGAGILLHKSPTPVLKDDERYALLTADPDL